MIKEDIKRYWLIGILYFIGLFAVKGLKLIGSISDPHFRLDNMRYYFAGHAPRNEALLTIGVGILIMVLLFSYLHTKKAAGMIHAYPLKRKTLFFSHMSSALLITTLPLLANTFATLLIVRQINPSEDMLWFGMIFSASSIWIGFLKMFLLNITVLAISACAAMVTGLTIIQAVLSIIFPFLPYVIGGIFFAVLQSNLWGFSMDAYPLEQLLPKVTPIIFLTGMYVKLSGLMILSYSIITLVLFIIAFYLYQKRNLEYATETIVFSPLSHIFKYGTAFCAMVFVGFYLQNLMKAPVWLYIGGVLGSYIGYIIAEMLLQKSIWVFHKWKGYAAFIGIMGIVFVLLHFDIAGYEKRIPSTQDIYAVIYDMPYRKDHVSREPWQRNHFITEPQSIQAVTNIHNLLIQSKDALSTVDPLVNNRCLYITYILKNGKELQRLYVIPADLLMHNPDEVTVVTSPEYKQMKYSTLFDIDEKQIDQLSIQGSRGKGLTLVNPDECRELIEILRQEVLASSYEEMTSPLQWGAILMEAQNNQLSEEEIYHGYQRSGVFLGTFVKTYDRLEQWLTQKGYIHKVRLMPEEIEYIQVNELKSPGSIHTVNDLRNRIVQEDTLYASQQTLTEPEEIEEILRTYVDYLPGSITQIVKIQLKSGESEYVFLKK